MWEKGKYQKQPQTHKCIYIILAVLVTLVVFGISSVAFYKAGKQAAASLQTIEPYTSIVIQKTAEETQPTTEEATKPAIEEATEATEATTRSTEATQPTTEATSPAERTGTVLRSAGELRVRSEAGTNHPEVSRLNGGDVVTIHEQKTVNGTAWGNIGYGWVCMDYIVFGVDTSVAPVYTTPPNYASNGNNYGANQNLPNQGSTNTAGIPRQFTDNAVLEKVFAAFKSKIQKNYNIFEMIVHTASYSDGYVAYDFNRGIYSCSLTAEYCTDYRDIFGTKTSMYFVNAELAESNGNLVITKIDIR